MKTLANGKIFLLLLVVVSGLTALDLCAQRPGRGGWNRFYRPYYQPSNRSYYGAPNPFYRIPTRPFYYYPPKHYPRATVPFRGYGRFTGYGVAAGYGYGYSPYAYAPYGASYPSPYPRATVATYYLSSPSASYYPEAYRETDREPVVRANYSHLLFNVTPGSALIFLDDKLVGSARSFGTPRERYEVLEGEYVLRIENPGYRTMETILRVVPDRTIHLDIDLQKIPD